MLTLIMKTSYSSAKKNKIFEPFLTDTHKYCHNISVVHSLTEKCYQFDGKKYNNKAISMPLHHMQYIHIERLKQIRVEQQPKSASVPKIEIELKICLYLGKQIFTFSVIETRSKIIVSQEKGTQCSKHCIEADLLTNVLLEVS